MIESGLDISPIITHRFSGATTKKVCGHADGRGGKVILDLEAM